MSLMISKNVIGIYARGGLFAGGGGLFAGGGGLFAGGPFAAGLIAGGLFASGLNAATQKKGTSCTCAPRFRTVSHASRKYGWN